VKEVKDKQPMKIVLKRANSVVQQQNNVNTSINSQSTTAPFTNENTSSPFKNISQFSAVQGIINYNQNGNSAIKNFNKSQIKVVKLKKDGFKFDPSLLAANASFSNRNVKKEDEYQEQKMEFTTI
jgi:hypothetical protein